MVGSGWSGKIKEFQVVLDNPSNVFFSGQIVEGRVMIVLTDEKKIKHLKLELEGKGEVRWSESSGSGETRRTRYYREEENYVHEEVILVDGPSLAAGSHYLPFSFNLPPVIPATYEGAYGYVRYYLKATMVRDWKFDYDVKHHITVLAELDLNELADASQGGRSQDQKNLHCFCFRTGSISATIGTDRQGFVPGEEIAFSAEVENQSKKGIKKSVLHLNEVATFITSRKSRTDKRSVCQTERGATEKGGQGALCMWEDVKMRVPPLAPTNLGRGCNIIKVEYELEFSVDPAGMHRDLLVTVPIVVGTIPLVSTIPTLAPPPLYEDQPNPDHPAPTQGWIVPGRPAIYPDLPPPSYNESVFGPTNVKDKEDNEHTRGNWEFLPKYPKYATKY